jgi:hypothetical protein
VLTFEEHFYSPLWIVVIWLNSMLPETLLGQVHSSSLFWELLLFGYPFLSIFKGLIKLAFQTVFFCSTQFSQLLTKIIFLDRPWWYCQTTHADAFKDILLNSFSFFSSLPRIQNILFSCWIHMAKLLRNADNEWLLKIVTFFPSLFCWIKTGSEQFGLDTINYRKKNGIFLLVGVKAKSTSRL